MRASLGRLSFFTAFSLGGTLFSPFSFAGASGWLTDISNTGIGDWPRFAKQGSEFIQSAQCRQKDRIPELVIDPEVTEQVIDGVGAALTESSVANLMDLSADSREKVLQDLFGKEGLRIGMVRVPVGSTDFSSGNRSCDDLPEGTATDPEMKHFSLSRCAELLIPILKRIREINPEVKFMASPWSAPAWMKTSGTMVGGGLKPEHYAAYAKYFVRFFGEMKKSGIDFQYLTVVNEPLFPGGGYPFMNMTWKEQRDFIKLHLGPALEAEKANIGAVGVLAFDHNTKDFEFPLNILKDAEARRYVAGTAFHCYEGSPELMRALKAGFPEKPLHLTECSLGAWMPGFGPSLEYVARELVIRNFGAGSSSLILWNLALNPEYGPTNHGCQTCRGIINIQKDKPREKIYKGDLVNYIDLQGKGQAKKEPEYYLFSHLSKVMRAGARKISSTYIQPVAFPMEALGAGTSPDLEQVAFLNPDQSIGVFMLNGRTSGELVFRVRTPHDCRLVRLPAKSIGSVLLN